MSSVSRTEIALAAAHADPTNAFTSLDDGALARAALLDESRFEGSLAGVPIAVKDIVDHAGRVTAAGSAFYRSEAQTTAPALARLETAGAIVIGRTGLHEFAFGFSSENPWFGPVHNPWDHALSPGGSSGGSAAAVASGIVPIAVGTDTGGSVRVPAALCGVVGLKVTHGLIPLDGVFPLVPSLDTVGAIAATLDHLAVSTWIMAGRDQLRNDQDPAVRLLVPRHWVDSVPKLHGTGEAFEEFLSAAADAGLEVHEAELPGLGPSSLQSQLIGPEVAAIHRGWREAGESYGPDVADRIDAALAVDPADLDEARTWQSSLTEAMTTATEGGTLLVTPTVGAMDKRIGDDRIDGHEYRRLLSSFTAPVNAAGCPALSVPVAGAGRMPSIQLIGRHGSEPRLLATARLLEERGLIGINPAPPTMGRSES